MYIRFQETTGIETSTHMWFDGEGHEQRDETIDFLYADWEDEENFELKEGFVFCFECDEEDFDELAKEGCAQAASEKYAVLYDADKHYETDGSGNGLIIDAKKAKIIKIIFKK